MRCSLLLLTLLAFGCKPKKTKSAMPIAQPAQAEDARLVDPSTLSGQWDLPCQEFSEGKALGVRSILATFTFKEDSTLVGLASYYTDDNCQNRFGRENAEDYLQNYAKRSGDGVPDDVKAITESLVTGFAESFTYTAEKVPMGQVGRMEMTNAKGTSYTSYRILEGRLYLAETCLPSEIDAESPDSCTLIGESTAHRATNVIDVQPYYRH